MIIEQPDLPSLISKSSLLGVDGHPMPPAAQPRRHVSLWPVVQYGLILVQPGNAYGACLSLAESSKSTKGQACVMHVLKGMICDMLAAASAAGPPINLQSTDGRQAAARARRAAGV